MNLGSIAVILNILINLVRFASALSDADTYQLVENLCDMGLDATGLYEIFENRNEKLTEKFGQYNSSYLQQYLIDPPPFSTCTLQSYIIDRNLTGIIPTLLNWMNHGYQVSSMENDRSIINAFSQYQVQKYMEELQNDQIRVEEERVMFEEDLRERTIYQGNAAYLRNLRQEYHWCGGDPVVHRCMKDDTLVYEKNLTIPLIFHVFGYKKNGEIWPSRAHSSDRPYRRATSVVNDYLVKLNAGFTFEIEQIRKPNSGNNDFDYLLFDNLTEYQDWYRFKKVLGLARKNDYNRKTHANIYVLGDSRLKKFNREEGLAFTQRANRKVQRWSAMPLAMSFGLLDVKGDNNARSFFAGAKTMLHELAHMFGVMHTHEPNECQGVGDCVPDTPDLNDTPVWKQKWGNKAQKLCKKIPEGDEFIIPSQFDSCKGDDQPDPILNVMTYSYPVCRRELTQGQIRRMYCVLKHWKSQMYDAAIERRNILYPQPRVFPKPMITRPAPPKPEEQFEPQRQNLTSPSLIQAPPGDQVEINPFNSTMPAEAVESPMHSTPIAAPPLQVEAMPGNAIQNTPPKSLQNKQYSAQQAQEPQMEQDLYLQEFEDIELDQSITQTTETV